MSMTDFFAPPASHSAKFVSPGDTISGQIKEISEPMQCTDYGTNKPSYWPSGDPMMQAKITLATDLRDPEDPQDDGKRGLWVVQSGKQGGLLWAIREAIKEAGVDTIKPGGFLQVAFVGTDPESKNPQNPRKMYQARYQGPAAGGGMFTGNPGDQGQQAPTTVENQMNHPTPAPQAPQGQAAAQAPQGQQAAFPQAAQQAPQRQQVRGPGEPGPFQQSLGNPQPQAPGGHWEGVDNAAPAQQPAGMSVENQEKVKQLLAMRFDTPAIVNAVADPTVTAEAVDALRAA